MEIYLDLDCNTTAINDSILNYTTSCNSTSTVTQFDIISLTISRLFMIIFLSAVIVSTITGNTLVVLAVFTTKKLRSITNFFVTNLAVADFLVGLFVMPPAVTSLITGSWQLGERVCDVWITLDVLLCTASILSLCAISIDRYLAVTQPLRYSRQKRSKKLAGVMIFAVWVISLAITCPPILGWSSKQEADCHYNQSPGYVIFSAMGSFFIPMMIMVFVYLKISSVVSRRHRQLSSEVVRKPKKIFRWACLKTNFEQSTEYNDESKSNLPGSSTTTPSNPVQTEINADESIELDMYQKNSDTKISIKRKSKKRGTIKFKIEDETRVSFKNKQRVSFKNSKRSIRTSDCQNNRVSTTMRENKTIKTLTIVMGGFIACWLPFFIMYLISPFIDKSYDYYKLMTISTWLGWFNSTINPFVYAFYSQEFRLAFWRLTFKRFCKNNNKNNFPA